MRSDYFPISYAYPLRCFEHIHEVISQVNDRCKYGDCEKNYFVVTPCNDFENLDVKRWEQIVDSLEDHYLKYQEPNDIGSTNIEFRFQALHGYTKVWLEKQTNAAGAKIRKLSRDIKDLLEQKLSSDPARKKINDQLVKIDGLNKSLETYKANSVPVKKAIDEFLKEFETYKTLVRRFLQELSEIKAQASIQPTNLDKDAVQSVWALLTKIENLELTNRSKSLEIENRGKHIEYEIKRVLKQFQIDIHPFKNVLSSQDFENGLDLGSSLEVIKKAQNFSIQWVSKFQEESISTSLFVDKISQTLIERLAKKEVNQRTKGARLLNASAIFIGKITSKTQFMRSSLPKSKVYELPFLSQHLQNLNELIEFSSLCTIEFDETNSWMHTGCRHLKAAVNGCQNRIKGFPDEIRSYIAILRALIQNPDAGPLMDTVEKSLRDDPLEQAIANYDSMLTTLGQNL